MPDIEIIFAFVKFSLNSRVYSVWEMWLMFAMVKSDALVYSLARGINSKGRSSRAESGEER